MANQSVRLKEEQLRREEEKLREIELKVQREIQIKRQELLAKEDSLKVLEARLGVFHYDRSRIKLINSFAKWNVMILTSVPFILSS
jgi:cell division control protein 11